MVNSDPSKSSQWKAESKKRCAVLEEQKGTNRGLASLNTAIVLWS